MLDRRDRIGEYSLSVAAEDDTFGGTGSGTRSIEVFVNGESQRSRGGYAERSNCPEGGCALSLDWTFPSAAYPEGRYPVEVVVKDQVAGQAGAPDERHTTRQAFDVVVDRTPPELDLAGPLKDKAGQGLTDGFWMMDAVAGDPDLSRATPG